MSEDRTPRTISLTELNDEEVEEPKRRSRRHDKGHSPDQQVRVERLEGEEHEHVAEMDPRDRARLTAR